MLSNGVLDYSFCREIVEIFKSENDRIIKKSCNLNSQWTQTTISTGTENNFKREWAQEVFLAQNKNHMKMIVGK